MAPVVALVNNPRGAVQSLTYYWDTILLEWVEGTQPGGSAGSSGVIVDGVSAAIKATVFDYTNSNPLAVVLRDTNGDYVSVGGGTQYTEDAAAPADPVGTVPALVRKDVPAATVSADGDIIAQRGTNYGAGYVTLLDSAGALVSFSNTQYTEDAVAAANPVGTALNLVRQDTLAGLVSADGDNVSARGTNKGELYVKHFDGIRIVDTGGDELSIGPAGDIGVNISNPVAVYGSLANNDGPVSLNVGTLGGFATAAAPTYIETNQVGFSTNLAGETRVVASALPLPSGAATAANQATEIASLSVMDDWDESDRAKVNPIVGQAGVEAGSGVITALTQRVVLATNQPVVPVSDNAGSLTVDNPTLSVVGGGVEATALRVTIATDSTGVLSVDDNGASLTVDSTQLPAALVGGRLDENVGAWLGSTAPTVGSKTSANSVPVVIASDQGAVAVSGPLTDAQLRATPVPISGTVTITDGAGAVNVIVDSGTLTAVTSITNVVHVDDNAGSLTVDGSVSVSNFPATQVVTGNKTNNNAAPGATNLGVLPAVATAAAPSYTEGNQVALSTDLTGQMRISGSISAATSADVLMPDGDPNYVVGDLGKNLTQTDDGRLRVVVAGLVSDTVESYFDGVIKSLSLNAEGRLRVATASESFNFTSWGDPETWGTDSSHINGPHPLSAW